MGEYEIEFSHTAAKQFAALPHDVQRRLAPRIDALTQDARPTGVEKLEGAKNA
jgi:mRNA interferase RelE/StbE